MTITRSQHSFESFITGFSVTALLFSVIYISGFNIHIFLPQWLG